ncbi:MAG: hypothetical protein HC831_10275 [Chloroflexia bacterium]|nr:hypothetical protein [Chloroflexia bacterium]
MKSHIFILVVVLMNVFSCKSPESRKNNENLQAEVYTCSMHPDVRSDAAGECPKCGMALIKASDHVHPDSSSNVDDEIK